MSEPRKGERRAKTNPFWQPMIDHINDTWKKKKGWDLYTEPEYNYPFAGRDMKTLRHWANMYMETGIMALWDAYLETADEWTVKHGYSIDNFSRQLPRLVDDYGWKKRRELYDARFPAKTPPEIIDLFSGLNVVEAPRRESQNEKWAAANPEDPRAKKYLSS